MHDVRAQASRVWLAFTPGTFRIISTTSTSETKYDYEQLPSKRAKENNTKEQHQHVNHLGLVICDWTKRVQSHELNQHVQEQLRSAELRHKRQEA